MGIIRTITINPIIDIDQYPLPKLQELLATLSGGQKLTKLDLSAAYQQMLLVEESHKLVTINTHLGLFRYCRLPFGIALAPAIFKPGARWPQAGARLVS